MSHFANVFFVGGLPPGRPIEHVPGAVMKPAELLSRAGLTGYVCESPTFTSEDQKAFDDSQMLVYCVPPEAIKEKRPISELVNEVDGFYQTHGNIVVFVPAEQFERTPLHAGYVNELLAALRALGAGRGFVVREHVHCFWMYLTGGGMMPRQRSGVPSAT